ncbi:hypothetical protein BCR42DRAFT_126989 [Absidia repens]|uniref:Uncharacterized protein n=1 Tax=Absidia repens TaxID=90262 RepID=A0A1X2IVE4_9FUNG|nr:hypothetical protein BCR42DRAFT_126989 [Absidia repens]
MNGLCLPRPIAQASVTTEKTAVDNAPMAPQRVMASISSPHILSGFPSPVALESTITSLLDLSLLTTPTLSPPTSVTDDFGLPLQPRLNAAVVDQNSKSLAYLPAQSARPPQQQQYIDEQLIRSQFQAEHGGQIGIVSPPSMTNNNEDVLQKNILRLENLEKAIQYLVTYGLSCDELLEWLNDPRAYNAVYEKPLMKCVKDFIIIGNIYKFSQFWSMDWIEGT